MGLVLIALKAVGGFFGGIFSSILKIVGKYPIQTACLVVVLGLCWASYHIGVARTTAVLNASHAAYVKQVTEEAQARNARIAELEKSSKEDADVAASTIQQKNERIETLSGEYQGKIAALLKNPKTLIVKIPVNYGAPPNSTVLIQDGKVTCRRLPTELGDSINAMVNAANQETK